MSTGEFDPREDRLAELLGGYDEALAAGMTLPTSPESSTDVDLNRRKLSAQAILRTLEEVWPRADFDSLASVMGVPTTALSTGPVASAGPITLGRFQILEELGRGGFGVVFLAIDSSLGRKVALKVPRPEYMISPETRGRFLREAKAAARLDHPNLVPIFEAGQIGPVCYIASAYCDGPTLASWLKDQPGPIRPQTAARLVRILAEAIQHAHDRGILHRDLKPGNILFQNTLEAAIKADGNELPFIPRVTDFGLARLVEHEISQTQSGLPMGSPPYMSPEQAEGRSGSIGPSTDVYALGAILYEMLSGRPLFRGDSVLEILEQVRSREPEPLSRIRPKVPRDLETICLTCLRKERATRYASARDLANDLDRFLMGQPVHARPLGNVARIWRWVNRPERIREAGWFEMSYAVIAVVWLICGIVLVRLGIAFHPSRPVEYYRDALGVTLLDFAPSFWLGWQITKRRIWAMWASLACAIMRLGILTGCLLGMPPNFGGFYDEPSTRIAVHVCLINLTLILALYNIVALSAVRARRIS